MGRAEFIVAIILCWGYGTSAIPRMDPLVDTKVGLIKGLTASDGDYSMFLGIPYATVDPLNPFGPSIPHPGFESTFNAIDDSAVCPQREEFNDTLVGTLDCLHLNVFVPRKATSKNRLPVLVWIHGGGFRIGFGGRYSQGPKYLVRHDVILVTLNYRLGAYGFLCPDIPEVPGNQGLRDQLTALRWVKNNIDAFGGDANQITLFGESAGAMSVDFHFIYAKENLFNKIILQSGTTLVPFAIRDPDPNGPLRLAEHLGYVTDDVKDALEFLSSVHTDLIVEATSDTNVHVRPCVENEYENVERFVTSHPLNMNAPKAITVPILIGYNSNEQAGSYENIDSEDFKNVNPFTDIPFVFDFDDEYLADMLSEVQHYYLGDEEISLNVKQQVANLNSDFKFYHPTSRSIRKYFDSGAKKIYHYMFSYDGGRNFVKRKDNHTEVSGALHADELSYLFDYALFEETPNAEDQLIIDRMTTLWTNFVKYSDPTPEITDLLPVRWPTMSNQVTEYLDIDSELSVKRRPFHDRMAYWDIFFLLNQSRLRGLQEN